MKSMPKGEARLCRREIINRLLQEGVRNTGIIRKLTRYKEHQIYGKELAVYKYSK